MNRLFLYLIIAMLAVSFILAGCAGGEDTETEKENMTTDTTDTTDTAIDPEPVEMEPVEAEPMDTVQVDEAVDVSFLQDYKNWELVKKDVASPAHMNAIKDVYVNSIGLDAFKSGTVPYPVGTIITKENYADESGVKGSMMALTCMIKMGPGYDPDNGDWAYVNTGADGVAQETGKMAMCIECHTKAKDKDYTFLSGTE